MFRRPHVILFTNFCKELFLLPSVSTFFPGRCRDSTILDGKAMAMQLFTLHKGPWEVFQLNSNKPAQLFWNKVIEAFTKGNFTGVK